MTNAPDPLHPASERRTFERFRLIAFAEGISYLLLLFLAMPLKYGLGWDVVVTWVGWAHGLLFIVYFVALAQCWRRYRWDWKTLALAALASLLPGGPFFMDRRLPAPGGPSPTSAPFRSRRAPSRG
jgi:integral membrane protein